MEREKLASLSYWRSPTERPPQRFYVAFCLLTSSIQDRLLGLKEQKDNNLNWSATCSYYSLVHAARLLSFLALGDFPTSHGVLRRLLLEEAGGARNRPPPHDGYPFDWLRGFTQVAELEHTWGRPRVGAANIESFRSVILGYLLEIGVRDAAVKLARLGRILDAAAPLRNNSNYEALLIAHEYRHIRVTSAFERLAEYMAQAAESSVPFAIEAFNRFFRNDPDLATNHEAYASFLYHYLHERILNAVQRKLRGYADLAEKLTEVVALIDAPCAAARYDHLEDQISIGIFGQKARLMYDFDSKIESLARIVGTHGEHVI